MKHLILLALVAASGATYGSKRQQWATGQQPELEWGRYLVGVSPLSYPHTVLPISEASYSWKFMGHSWQFVLENKERGNHPPWLTQTSLVRLALLIRSLITIFEVNLQDILHSL